MKNVSESKTYVSSGEDEPVATATCSRPVLPAKPNRGSNKRLRADSGFDDIPAPLCVVITCSNTPFEPSSPTEPTPTPSEFGASSGASDTGESAISDLPRNGRRDQAQIKRLLASNIDPEVATIKRIEQSKLPAYTNYDLPTIEKREGKFATHHLFKCKRRGCEELVRWAIGTMETSGLFSHTAICFNKLNKHGGILHKFGFTGGTRLTEQQVQEAFALWFAEHAQPYGMVQDKHLPTVLHPDARKHKLCPKTISVDIILLYQATQQHITSMLLESVGVFHIGLDLCQSDSGFDFLGLVIFRLFVKENEPVCVNRFVLKCLSYEVSHTSAKLAKATWMVLKKFGIQDGVWGVVCDNASNNGKLMECLKKKKLKRLNGPLARLHCMLHVLNLVAKVALKPFHQKRQHLTARADADSDDDNDDDNFEATATDGGESGIDEDDDGTAPSHMVQEDDSGASDEEDNEGDVADEEEEEYVPPKIAPGSADEAMFKQSVKVLYKIAKLAHKLRYSPSARAAFKKICAQLGLDKPHSVRRDMKIRWNSTDLMLEDAYHLFEAILEFQVSTKFLPQNLDIHKDDQDTIEHLLAVLKPICSVSDILARAGVPVLADVIPHYDALSHEYEWLRSDLWLPLYIRQASHRAWGTLNKYYQKTDELELYRLAVVMHPSMRVHYLKQAGWEEEWITTAVEMAVECWKKHYQQQSTSTGKDDAAPFSQFNYSNFLDQMFSTASEPRRADTSYVHEFVYGAIVVDRSKNGRAMPVNPIAWWHAQRVAGNEWDGLAQMALDVLSTPATRVDVKRAFSFVGTIVSKRRHSLAPYSIQATQSLGSYSKAGLVKPGSLVLPSKVKGTTTGKGKNKATINDQGGAKAA